MSTGPRGNKMNDEEITYCQRCKNPRFLVPLEDEDQNHKKMQVCKQCKKELKAGGF